MQISRHAPSVPFDSAIPHQAQAAWKAAQDVEATFLAEMLKSAGLTKSGGAFGGGVGEEQFSSMLVREQAEHMTKAGGIGLTEMIFNILMEAENGTRRPE